MNTQRILAAIGRGLIAGLAGTAAITISSTIEMKLRKRPASTTPGKVGGKVLGVKPRNQEGMKRFSNAIHWDYGMSWGLFLTVTDLLGMQQTPASIAHFATVWGAALAILPAADAAKPITEWSTEEIAIDILHHALYAAAAGLTYNALLPSNENTEESEFWDSIEFLKSQEYGIGVSEDFEHA